MSLINEALKRAEAEKHGQPYQAPERGEGVPPLRPAGILPAPCSPANGAERQAPPSQQGLHHAGSTPSVHTTSSRHHLVPWAIVAVIALAGGPLALRVWMGTGTPAPQSADAAVAPMDRLNVADAAPSAGRSIVKAPARPVETPPALLPVAAAPSEPPSTTPASAPASAPSVPAPKPAVTAADVPPVVAAVPTVVVPPVPAPTPIASQPASPPTLPASEPSYKLTGTMRGSDGWMAVINGQVVQVGEMIDDAKVLKITAKNVTLESNGKRLTLGL